MPTPKPNHRPSTTTREAHRSVLVANHIVERFMASTHAQALDPFIATMAAHCLLAHHFEQRGVDGAWSRFDVVAFLRWLGENSLFHPAAGAQLVDAWVALVGFMAGEGVVDGFTARRLTAHLMREEENVLDLVIDRYLRFALTLNIDRAS